MPRTHIATIPESAWSIAGTVTDHIGAPLRGICAFATSAQDAGGLGNGLDGLLSAAEVPFSDIAGTGRNGNYRIANLIPGSYAVSFAGVVRQYTIGADGSSVTGGPDNANDILTNIHRVEFVDGYMAY